MSALVAMRRKADVTRASCHDVPAVTYGTDAGTICARFASTLTQRTPKETARIPADFTKLPASAFEGWLFTKKDYFRDPTGGIDIVSLQRTFDVQKDLGLLKTKIDAKSYVDLSVVEEADERLK
jgi:hypothetical protein